ncbi:hypothetical protein AVEN_62907-1 [Araneus ventricosus]|uniref:Tc1-like transposase DDE domain-containing protein n=1 Tax=Araneus ventricosus TaxID=182803 RepID=A0A4Y2D0M2_ARAVE|nr:hypothetical protein AVEN_62907-1 [Araneus ventricosus]
MKVLLWYLPKFSRRVGVVHHEFVQAGQTVNGSFHVQVLKRLRQAIRRKSPAKWQGGWSLHHDNAPSHTSIVVQTWLAEKNILLLHQPPYSPDLAPSDFSLFPKIKMGLKGNRFDTVKDIKTNATADLQKISQHDFHLRIECVHDGVKIVEFTGLILDKPKVISSDVGKYELDINEAYRMIDYLAKAGKLSLKMSKDGQVMFLESGLIFCLPHLELYYHI